jgi:hypothetical protein
VHQAREKLGRGVRHGWDRQREITLHEINILVPKEINKDSELSSFQGTQGMITAWIFATTVAGFLGFGKILLPYSQVQYTVYDIFFMHYLHFNNCSPLRTVFKRSHFIIKNFVNKFTHTVCPAS